MYEASSLAMKNVASATSSADPQASHWCATLLTRDGIGVGEVAFEHSSQPAAATV
jgi:hypothetical protein